MKKTLLLLFALIFGLIVSAQTKRIAILETIDKENTVSYAVEVMVRSNLTKVISNTPGYEGYDRVNISQIMDEHDFERTGLVSEEQIRQLGVISGADYLLVSEAVKVDESNIFVTAKILNVETAKTESSENALMGVAAQDIQHGCESLANRLLGLPDPYLQENFIMDPQKKEESSFKEKEGELWNRMVQPQKEDSNFTTETTIVSLNNQNKIGELINFPDGSQGVVFYLDENGRGLAVSLNEGEEVWDDNRRPDDISSLLNVEDGEDKFIYGEGLKNTQTIVDALGDDAHAAYWCVLQGGGWYLPSCGELMVLMSVVKENSPVANTLRSFHSNDISGWYWSSTENENKEAWNVSSSGFTSTEKKKGEVKVRAIRAFTIQ